MHPIHQDLRVLSAAIGTDNRAIGANHSIGTSPISDESFKLLFSGNFLASDKDKFFVGLRKKFSGFLRHACHGWKSGERFHRLTIFGDSITCLRWNNEGLISAMDVIKVVKSLIRLHHSHYGMKKSKILEEVILSYLRSIKINDGALLEEAGSPILRAMYVLNAIKTQKKQKVFIWSKVPFYKLFDNVISRENGGISAAMHKLVGKGDEGGESIRSSRTWSPGSTSQLGLLALAEATMSDLDENSSPMFLDQREALPSVNTQYSNLALVADAAETRYL